MHEALLYLPLATALLASLRKAPKKSRCRCRLRRAARFRDGAAVVMGLGAAVVMGLGAAVVMGFGAGVVMGLVAAVVVVVTGLGVVVVVTGLVVVVVVVVVVMVCGWWGPYSAWFTAAQDDGCDGETDEEVGKS